MTMTDKKFTDEEIIKALNICSSGIYECNCGDCYMLNYSMDNNVCMAKLMRDTKDLITHKQADILRLKSMNQAKLDTIHDLQVEIEQWKEEANKYQNLWCRAVDNIETAKAEVYKEFAEELMNILRNTPKWNVKKLNFKNVGFSYDDVFFSIENLLKEKIKGDLKPQK